ncbi:MAG: hypothetical protein EBS00_03880 [Verrucomicrobia bacterium]|nr:hypothetical protein [Verrucomicrobiota bacterium]
MILLRGYKFSEGGCRIDYDYTATGRAARFLNPSENFFVRYDVDVSGCPPSIVLIPFISNLITLAWFGGFDLHVPEAESTYSESLKSMRAEFQRMYPQHRLTGNLVAERLTAVNWTGDAAVMLFSGGIDAFATLIRHRDEPLQLVTIWGADIELSDTQQWNRCLNHIARDPLSSTLPHTKIVSNLRTFYTDKVENDLVYGWWGMVQHGPALLGLQAPLTCIYKANRVYIASSYSVSVHGGWGSTKETDEKLKWGPVRCIHDADALTRNAKVQIIVDCAKRRGQPIPLRVCYSEVQRDGNCGRCEKCYRSIMNLILTNADPRDYGFPMTESTYPHLMQLMSGIHSSSGLKIFWGEIAEDCQRALARNQYFVLADKAKESAYLQRIADGELNRALERNHRPWKDAGARWKFILRVRFPAFYNIGRGLVRQLRRFK